MNGRPVRLAPRRPGASPTISRRASTGPKEGTGALNQSGSLAAPVICGTLRGAGRAGNRAPGLPDAAIASWRSIFGAQSSNHRRRQAQRRRPPLRGGAGAAGIAACGRVAPRGSRGFARPARSAGSRPIFGCSSTMSRKMSAWRRNSSATIGGWVEIVETTVTRTPCAARPRPASGNRRRRRTAPCGRCAGDLHGVDRKLDVHVALDLAAAGLVDEFLGRLGDDRVAVVVEPIDQRPDRGIFLILDHGGVIERAQQIAARLELAQQPLVVDVETERLGGGVEIGAVNEQRDFFGSGTDHGSRLVNQSQS